MGLHTALTLHNKPIISWKNCARCSFEQVQIVLQRYCHVHLSVNQQAALISFIFNCGSAAFRNSTLLKRLNEEQYLLAADEFLKWVYVKDKKLKGLVKRRQIERAVFLEEINLI
jgi:lysozyme